MTFLAGLIQGHRTYKAVDDRRKALQPKIAAADTVRAVHGLTLCTVNFRTSEFLKRSRELLDTLNPNDSQFVEWLVIENTPIGEPALDESLPGFRIVRSRHTNHFSSYGHGSGFNELLPLITTRFALFIDPDCFVIRPNWISDVLDHMKAHGLAFFGTPTHPRSAHRFRYFPSPICMFVDLSRVPAASLDFTPPASRWTNKIWFFWILTAISRIPWPFGPQLARLSVNQLQDVGYRIYRRFRSSGVVGSEVATPVFYPGVPSVLSRVLNRYLPDRFNIVPKKAGYTTVHGFEESGLYDARGEGWEEFMWRDAPFAFHIRGVTRDSTDRTAIARKTPEFLDSLPTEAAGKQ